MTTLLPRHAARLFNTPLMVHPGKAVALVSALSPRLLGAEIAIDGPEPITHVAFGAGRPIMGRLGNKLGERLAERGVDPLIRFGNVAVIPVEGSLVHKGKYVGAFSGETSYEGLHAQVSAARSDAGVRGVVFEVDSFGGEVAGAFDLAAAIRALSAEKPTLAILTDHALSAGYLLASAARRVVMPESGMIGSIGVIMLHADISEAARKQGVKVTVLSAGAHKADGNRFEPLPDAVAERFRADLEAARVLFAEAVGLGRGDRFSRGSALATEADDYRGEEAVDLGLADAAGHPSEAFEAFLDEINAEARPTPWKGFAMSTVSEAARAAAGSPGLTQADVEAARADGFARGKAEGFDAGKAEGARTAAETERARVKGILDHEAAKGREGLARHFAFDTNLSPEMATAALAKAPAQTTKAEQTPQQSPLVEEMRALGNRSVSADGGTGAEHKDDYEKGAAAAKALLDRVR